MLKVEKLCRGETFVNFANFDTFFFAFCYLKCIIVDNALGVTALHEQSFKYFILSEQLGHFQS